jgi:hypothetical protein
VVRAPSAVSASGLGRPGNDVLAMPGCPRS